MKDREFLAEAGTAQIQVTPLSGADMEREVRAAYALPDATVAKVRKVLAD
jgi:hypothetical protein